VESNFHKNVSNRKTNRWSECSEVWH